MNLTTRTILSMVLFSLFAFSSSAGIFKSRFSINRSASMIEVSRTNFVDTVAIDVAPGGYLIFEAEVEGRILHLALDTGSAIGFFYGELDTGDIPFDVTTTGVNLPVNDINRVEMQLPVVIAPPITIGGTTYGNYPMFVAPKSSFQASAVLESYGVDAMIGFNFIRRGLNVKIDVEQGIMVITDIRDFFAAEKASFRMLSEDSGVSRGAISFRYDGYLTPSIPVSIGGFKFKPTFDTGASRTLLSMGEKYYRRMASSPVYRDYVAGITVAGERPSSGIGIYGPGEFSQTHSLKVPTVNVSGLKLKNVSMQTVPSDGTIGLPFLDYTAVIIEPYNYHITFEPYGGFDTFVAERRILSIRLSESEVLVNSNGKIYMATEGMRADPYLDEDVRLRVISVLRGSGLYEKGVRSGDFLLSVDGVQIHSVEDFEALKLGNNFMVFQSPEGKTKSIRATREDLYSE